MPATPAPIIFLSLDGLVMYAKLTGIHCPIAPTKKFAVASFSAFCRAMNRKFR
jgi:hypothetical protein